jgi:hypothetical protein
MPKFIAAAALMLRLPFALASLNYAWLKTFLVVLQSGSARESGRPLGAVRRVSRLLIPSLLPPFGRG